MSCLVVNTFQGLPRKEKKRKAEEAAEEPAAKEVKVVPPQDTKRWVGWSTQIREKHGKSTKILRIYVFQLCFIVYIYILYCRLCLYFLLENQKGSSLYVYWSVAMYVGAT